MQRSPHSPLSNRLSDFYSRMSDAAQTAATLVNVPSERNAAALRTSLEKTIQSVDQLTAAMRPIPTTDQQGNNP